MTARQGSSLVIAAVLAVFAVAVTSSGAVSSPTSSAAAASTSGKQLYREFCGQCHALSQALSAGFGSDNGLGTNGGPSFNDLRVPFAVSIVAVTEPTGGHEVVRTKISFKQLREVASYISTVTAANPILATATDG